MKILFLTPRNSRKHIGGVETHVRLLTEELERRGYSVEELTLDDVANTCKGPTLPRQGRTLRYKLSAWGNLWEHRDLIQKVDIVHVHDVFWWYLPFRFLFPTKPAYVTFHGWEGECPPSRSAIIQKRIAKKLSRGTIGVGRFFKKWYGVSPDQISWGAFEDKWTNRPIDKLTNGQMKKFSITFYGRLDAVNGIDIAIEAFRTLQTLKGLTLRAQGQTLRNKLKFLFIGDGPARKEAENIGTVTGMVNNPQTFLLQSDLVVTSSYLCMLEAAVLMRPIFSIATNPLKNDYLTTNPLAGYITLVRSSKELVDRISSFDVYTQREVLRRAKNWSLAQTPKKLADIYINLWRTDVSIPIN